MILMLLRFARDGCAIVRRQAEEWMDYLDMWHDILDPDYLDKIAPPMERID